MSINEWLEIIGILLTIVIGFVGYAIRHEKKHQKLEIQTENMTESLQLNKNNIVDISNKVQKHEITHAEIKKDIENLNGKVETVNKTVNDNFKEIYKKLDDMPMMIIELFEKLNKGKES